MEPSVQELTAAIASGDTEAFARFYHGRFDEMYAEARRATGRDESFCLDVVQDAMIRVIKSLRPMESEGSLRAWLRAVVQCCSYDRLRSDGRRARRERAAVEARPAPAADDDRTEKLVWLRRELAGLDDQQARLLVMRYRLGWTLQRIGEALGLKPGAVDGRVKRVVRTLRRRAEEQFHDG